MSRVNNAHYMDPTWAQVSENLADALGGGARQRAAQYENQLTQARSQQQADRRSRQDHRARYSAADAFEADRNQRGMADLIRAGELDALGQTNMAFGGEQLAQGRATPDQQRARMAGAGIEPDQGLALTGARADQMREQDSQWALDQALGEIQMENAGRLDQQRLVNQQAQREARMEDERRRWETEFEAGQPGMQEPMSADEAIAWNVMQGDLETAAQVAGLRYGEGSEAVGTGAGDRHPLQDARARIEAENQIATLIGQYYPELPEEDQRRIESAAIQQAQAAGWDMDTASAIQAGAEALGGVDMDRTSRSPWTLGLFEHPDPGLRDPEDGREREDGAGASGQEAPRQSVPVLRMPDGEVVTSEQIDEAAEGRGISREDAIEILREKGGQPVR